MELEIKFNKIKLRWTRYKDTFVLERVTNFIEKMFIEYGKIYVKKDIISGKWHGYSQSPYHHFGEFDLPEDAISSINEILKVEINKYLELK